MPRFIEIPHLPAFQKLHNGLPVGKITAIYGPPEGGKSTLAAKLAMEAAMHLDGNILIFDTENSVDTYDAWHGALADEFDVDVNLIEMVTEVASNKQKTNRKYDVGWTVLRGEENADVMNWFCLSCPDIQDILVTVGRGCEIEVSDNADSGKMKQIMQTNAYARHIEDAPFYQFCEAQNIKCIVVDSFTNPLDEIPDNQADRPLRAKLSQMWLIQLHKIAAKMQIPIICIFHESKNEAGAFSKELKMQGGKGVLYNVKYVVYVFQANSKGLLPSHAVKPNSTILKNPHSRAAYVSRHPYKASWAEVAYFELSDQGIHDLDGESVESASDEPKRRKPARRTPKTTNTKED